MRTMSVFVTTAAIALALTAAPASAQQSAAAPHLHVSNAHGSCFFDLHPELTQAEFDEFAGELGSILRFRQLGATTTPGKGRFDLGVQYVSTSIDDAKGAWNNTMSHPTADHYLGDAIAFPRLVLRYGLSDRVDVGGWGGFNPGSNYGVVGVDTNIALLRQDRGKPISLAVRPSFSSLVGPAEVWAGNVSVDLTVTRTFGSIAPYGGISASSSIAVERSKDVDLDPGTGGESVGYVGVSYQWRGLIMSGEVERGHLTSYGFRIGTRF